MPSQSLPDGVERVYLEVTIDRAEKRDFFHGRDESPADIDWAYHLRMGDLRFVEHARLATVPDLPKIEEQVRQQVREELREGLKDAIGQMECGREISHMNPTAQSIRMAKAQGLRDFRAALSAAFPDQQRDHDEDQPCGWCHGEGAIADPSGRLAADCPRCSGRAWLLSSTPDHPLNDPVDDTDDLYQQQHSTEEAGDRPDPPYEALREAVSVAFAMLGENRQAAAEQVLHKALASPGSTEEQPEPLDERQERLEAELSDTEAAIERKRQEDGP